MTTIIARAVIFDETQPKYKCCCGCMSVRTGAAIIATLKMFGVLMAVLELFTGPHFMATPMTTSPGSIGSTFAQKYVQQDTNNELGYESMKLPSTTQDPSFDVDITSNSNDDDSDGDQHERMVMIGNQAGFGAVRFASTAIYLLVEAVAVSCLFYAFRTQRAKFVIPEMALIMICMSLEMVVAVLVIMGASFGSDTLVRMVVDRMRAQGTTDITETDVEQIRRMIPFVLTAFAFALMIGAAVEFWFFRTLKSYYVYLRDKESFRAMCGGEGGDSSAIQHHRCYVNGYQPMMEEGTTTTTTGQAKDMPPTYQDVIKVQSQVEPPSYVDSTTQPGGVAKEEEQK